MRHRLAYSALGLLLSSACTEPTIDPVPTTLEVIVTTLGVDVDPDGYQVTISRHPPVDVPVNDTLTLEVADGNYTVSLAGLAPNCATAGVDERQVTVRNGASAQASFQVNCGSTSGVVRVETHSVGDAIDPDGYQVTISSPGPGNTMTLPANGFLDIPIVIPGSYVVTLSGLSASCVVAGSNTRAVTVATGQLTRDTTFATFQIACLGGVVAVTVSPAGLDQDSIYTVSVDGDPPVVLGRSDSLLLAFEVGDHTFELGDVTPNCTVQGANPVTLTIAHGARVNLTFVVQCRPNVATVKVTNSVTGATIDNTLRVGMDLICDYWYYICEFAREAALPLNGSVILDVGSGSHTFHLLDLAANCVVPGGSPITVNLPATDTVEVRFDITCAPAASIRVSAPTTGVLPDDEYYVYLDNQAGVPVSPGTTLDLGMVLAGQHIVSLGDVSPNCSVTGGNPRVITVTADVAQDVVFQVTCDPDATLVIATPTTGGDLDASYVAVIDNASGITVPANGSVSVPVYGGVHTIGLTDLAANCSVTVATPVAISVPAGGTATATIPVLCTRVTGTARLTLTATGPNLPPNLVFNYACDYYIACSQLAVPVNGAGSVDLLPGFYIFSLNVLPANCTIAPATSAVLAIETGLTSEAAFTLTCQ